MENLSIKAAEICGCLKNLGIEFECITHPPAFTIEECKRVEGLIGGKICKNLFLRTTSGNSRFLLMMDGDKKFVTKDISKKLGSSRLSFVSGEEMQTLVNTLPGSLGIMSLIFDKEKKSALPLTRLCLRTNFSVATQVSTPALSK